MPEDLRDRNSHINRLKACKERLERENAQARQAQQDKIDRRKAKENTGKKSRGRKPKSPEDVTQQENDKQQLHPMLEQTESNRQSVGIKEETGAALADAGWPVGNGVYGAKAFDRAWPQVV